VLTCDQVLDRTFCGIHHKAQGLLSVATKIESYNFEYGQALWARRDREGEP
jgi:hypothetical protein